MLQIHKASAGSGKTYALTREYLRLLLGEKNSEGAYRLRPLSAYGYRKPKPHGEILAVTFTNKATEEMTSRIINELAALAGEIPGKTSPYEKEFLEDFATDAPSLRSHARRALADVLYNFSWFNVSTIDSFFQRVLNTFTRELDLPPNHGVELDDRYPLAVAVGNMLNSIKIDYEARGDKENLRQQRLLEKWLERYMSDMMSQGDSFNMLSQSSGVFSDLIECFGHFFSEKYKLNRKAIDRYLSDPQRIVEFAKALGDNPAMKAMQQQVVEACAAVKGYDTGRVPVHVLSVITAFSEGDFSKLNKLSDTFRGAMEDPAKRFKKAKNKKDILDPGLEMAMDRVMTLVAEFGPRKNLADAMLKWVYYLGLFGHVHRFLDEYRQENETLLLSDTNDLLHRIISEDETPFIYERMGTTIRHYLIDEFQDTSQMQWDNLKPLVLESLSHDHDNLIIGDEKQCIYRFRNSDPQLLGSRVETLVKGRFPDGLSLKGVKISENCNWRSSAEVVKFNNSLFYSMARLMEDGMDTNPISTTYAGLIQMIPEKHAHLAGYVRVEFMAPEKDDSEPAGGTSESAETTETAGEGGGKNDPQLESMTREISRQLDAGYHPRDIAVLVRLRAEGKRVIQYLMNAMESEWWAHGRIPIMSADAMSISLSPAVRMIVNVLRLVVQPNLGDNVKEGSFGEQGFNAAYRRIRLIHRFELARFDMVPVEDEQGRLVRGDNGEPLMRRLTDREALEKAVAATSVPLGTGYDEVQGHIDNEIRQLANMDSPTLLAMTDRIIDRFLTPDARRRENAFITAFQDLVMDFTDNGDNNVATFLEWWDRCGSETNVQAPDGLDAINVMTIHKAKGLEFDCVHVPYFSGETVKYYSPKRKSISWYTLKPEDFPGVPAEYVPPMLPLPNKKDILELSALKAEGDEWLTEQKTDALNVAYVALTRAVRELCVYVDKWTLPESKGEGTKIGDYLRRALLSVGGEAFFSRIQPEALPYMTPLSENFNEDTGLFTYGDPTEPEHKDEATGTDTDAPKESRPEDKWLEEYYIQEHSEICASMDFEDLVAFNLADDRHRGIFLHEVLSRVKHLGDLGKALDTMAYRYGLTPEEKADCREVLENALADPRVQPWFEGYRRALTERPITAPDVAKRPDRVVWHPDGTLDVIDYKFGSQHRKGYHRQVRGYMSMLAKAGHPGARGFLWYPLTGEIEQVK